MSFDNQTRYYEQKSLWKKDVNSLPAERERLMTTIELIPHEVKSILDIGCGSGAFLNALPTNYKTVGVDFSREALQYVKTVTVQSNAGALPFPDSSFDLVTCLEVLEHLPYTTFPDTLCEITRITRKYVIVSVPNQQNLDLLLVRCPICHCQFHPRYHVRSFSPLSLESLFPDLKPLEIKEIGPVIPMATYPRFVVDLYKAWKNKPMSKHAICPQCGYKETETSKNKNDGYQTQNLQKNKKIRGLLLPFRLAAKVIWPHIKRSRWLIALYAVDHL